MAKGNGGNPAAEPADGPMIEHEPDASPPAATPPSSPPELPTEHLLHAAVYHGETTVRLQGFNTAITALRTQREGTEEKHKQAMKEAEAKHATEIAAIDARIVDLEEAAGMAQAAIAAKYPDNEK